MSSEEEDVTSLLKAPAGPDTSGAQAAAGNVESVFLNDHAHNIDIAGTVESDSLNDHAHVFDTLGTEHINGRIEESKTF